MTRLIKILVDISIISESICLLVAVPYFNSKPRYLKLLGLLTFCSVAADLTVLIYVPAVYVAGNLYTIIQFILLGLIFHEMFGTKSLKRWMLVLVLLFLVFSVVNLFYIEGFLNRNDNLRTISSLSFMIVPILYFRYILIEQPIEKVLNFPMFWVNSGILLYFSGNLILFTVDSTMNTDNIYVYFYIIHDLLNSVLFCLFGVAFIISIVNRKQIVEHN